MTHFTTLVYLVVLSLALLGCDDPVPTGRIICHNPDGALYQTVVVGRKVYECHPGGLWRER